MQKKFMDVEGRRLSYVDEGQGPVLVFGHSFLWDADMWRAQVDALSGDFRCVVPELWGHGESDPVSDAAEADMDALAGDMQVFTETLGLDRFSLIGLSVGGMWAARLAHCCPDRVEKLVLMDTDLGEEPPESRAQFMGMIEMAAQAKSFPPPLVEAVIPFYFCEHTRQSQPDLVEALRSQLLNWPAEKMAGALEVGRGVFFRKDFLPELAEIQCPALVMCGEHDPSRPPAEAEVLAERLPNARLELIPDAGHIPTVEQPEAVNRLLRQFLMPERTAD